MWFCLIRTLKIVLYTSSSKTQIEISKSTEPRSESSGTTFNTSISMSMKVKNFELIAYPPNCHSIQPIFKQLDNQNAMRYFVEFFADRKLHPVCRAFLQSDQNTTSLAKLVFRNRVLICGAYYITFKLFTDKSLICLRTFPLNHCYPNWSSLFFSLVLSTFALFSSTLALHPFSRISKI